MVGEESKGADKMKTKRPANHFEMLARKYLNGRLNERERKHFNSLLQSDDSYVLRLRKMAKSQSGENPTCRSDIIFVRDVQLSIEKIEKEAQVPDVRFGTGIHRCIRGRRSGRLKKPAIRRHRNKRPTARKVPAPWFPLALAACLFLVSAISFGITIS